MEQPRFLTNAFGERYLYEANRTTFNGLGSAGVFERHFGESLFRKDTLNIVIGTDSGLLIRHVQSQGVPEGSRYLFIELDALLPSIQHELSDVDLDEAIQLAVVDKLEDRLGKVRFSDYANIGAINLMESIGAIDAYHADYTTVTADIRQRLDALLWAYSCQLSSPAFIRCQLRNLIEEHVAAEALSNHFGGRTALLLGGGPSLDAVLPWAKQHQESVTIFAVSRICRRLLETGITPHVVVSIDPNELSFDISKEMLLLDPKVLFAHANHVAYTLLAQWRGRSVYLDRRFPWQGKLDTTNISAAGPTVTNTAFALARAMGFARVILGGVDLCHSSEGYSHARGSNEHDAGPLLGGTGMQVRTNAGHEAETTPDFYNAILTLGSQAKAARAEGLEVVSPAPDAALIDGVEFTALDEIILPPPMNDLFDDLHSCLPADSPQARIANLSMMQRELARAHGRLREVIGLAKEALECNAGLFGRNGKTADFRHKKRMDKIERQLDKRLKDLSEIVRLFSSRAFLNMPPSDREWSDAEIELAGITYYSAYRDNAHEVLQLVEQAQERVESVLAEEQSKPDFERLLRQWEKDHVPGRAAVWAHRHPGPAAKMPANIRQRFDQLAEDFNKILAQRDTSHARKIRAQVELTPVRARLQRLFKEGNTPELQRTCTQLAALEQAEASELRLLALGYLAELGTDHEAAFEHYNRVVDAVREGLSQHDDTRLNPRLEDALRRMAFIAMSQNWREQAQLVLQTLAELAPIYEPQYAEMLRLSGDFEAAATVYTSYLSKAPSDHVAMLRLGKTYQAMGSLEAARTAFDYVLRNDPDNQAAKVLLEQTGTAA